jgi:superkiller protein 3
MTKSLHLFLLVALVSILSFAGCKRGAPTTNGAVPQPNLSLEIETSRARAEKTPTFDNLTSLGLVYSRAGRHNEAAAAFVRAAQVSPNNALAFNNVCAEYNALSTWKLAQDACHRALMLQPDFPLAKNNLALADRSKAAQDLNLESIKHEIAAGRAVDANKLNLGLGLYSEGEYEQAVAVWHGIQKGNALYATALNNTASAYILLKKFDEARAAIGEALKLDPKNERFKNNLAWLNTASSPATH